MISPTFVMHQLAYMQGLICKLPRICCIYMSPTQTLTFTADCLLILFILPGSLQALCYMAVRSQRLPVPMVAGVVTQWS